MASSESGAATSESNVDESLGAGDESDPTLPDGVGAACALISLPRMAQILGGTVEAVSAGDAACVFHTEGDSPNSVEIAELPSAVLPGQLGEGTFTTVAGIGDKAYWSADETLLIAVKGPTELGINASVGDDQDAAQRAAVAVATAALPAL